MRLTTGKFLIDDENSLSQSTEFVQRCSRLFFASSVNLVRF